MTQEERLFYCKQCKNRAFNPKVGLICGLNNEKPSFDTTCKEFNEDELVKRNNLMKVKYNYRDVSFLPAQIKNQLYKEQNFGLALVLGIIASIISASLWALTVAVTKLQITILAIAFAYGIAHVVKYAGRGLEKKYAVLSAALTLISVVLGQLFGFIMLFSYHNKLSFWDSFLYVDATSLINSFIQNFGIFTGLFCLVAMITAYKFSLREVSRKRVEDLEKASVQKSKGDKNLLDDDLMY